MKKFIWVVSCLFFAVHGWAANNIKMVSYFPIPYASYSDLKVEGVCDLGLLGKCEMKAGSLTVDSADPAQTAKMQVNSGTLKLDPAVGTTPKIAADFLYVGNVEDLSTASWFNVEDYLSISDKFLDQDKIKGLSATEATLRQVALRGKDGAFLDIPSCAATDNEINWKNLTIDGRQGVYLVCGESEARECDVSYQEDRHCEDPLGAYTESGFWNSSTCSCTCPSGYSLDQDGECVSNSRCSRYTSSEINILSHNCGVPQDEDALDGVWDFDNCICTCPSGSSLNSEGYCMPNGGASSGGVQWVASQSDYCSGCAGCPKSSEKCTSLSDVGNVKYGGCYDDSDTGMGQSIWAWTVYTCEKK